MSEIVLTKEEIYQARDDMCAELGLTVWEAEGMIVADEIPWGCILSTNLQRARFMLGEPALARPEYF